MDKGAIKWAVRMAKEFIDRANRVTEDYGTYENDGHIFHNDAPATARGALRRQSMELTRALSAMRKP